MKKVPLILSLLFSMNVIAASLTSSDSKLINAAGIPSYTGANFVYGNNSVGYRFASSKPVKEVQDWYRKQLPKWSIYNKYGGWILHNGSAGAGMAEVMSSNQINIKHNDQLPQWHSLDKNMTTEIVIMIAK